MSGLLGAFYFVESVSAEKLFKATSLTPCSDDGIVAIDLFSIVYTPSNESIQISFDGSTSYAGKFLINLDVLVYGYKFLTYTVDPCRFNVAGLCPLSINELNIQDISLAITGLSGIPSQY